MTAYYNEHDPQAAAWLRELIKEGVIAPGEVDERSIEDVIPAELAGFAQCHFFAGLGIWSYALRCAGWPDDRPVWTGSCPCQPFSAAGKRGGTSDERHLWPAFYHLISVCRPDVIFGEQVASKDGFAWLDTVHADLEAEAYAVGAVSIPACGVGAPHRRERLFFVAESENIRHERSGQSRRWRNGLENCGAVLNVANADSNSDRARRCGSNRETPIIQRINRTAESSAGKSGRTSHIIRNVADALPAGRPKGRPEPRDGQTTGSGGFNELGDSESIGRDRRQDNGDGRWRQYSSGQASEIDIVGDAESERWRETGERDRRSEKWVGNSGESLDVGDSHVERLQGRQLLKTDTRRDNNSQLVVRTPSATNGFWRDTEWLYCRDGKYRAVERATKSELEQMADGTPGDLRFVCLTCGTERKKVDEDLCDVRQGDDRNARFEAQEVLQRPMLRQESGSGADSSDSRQLQSAVFISGDSVREMRRDAGAEENPSPPQRPQPTEQCTGEYRNTVRYVPQEGSRAAAENVFLLRVWNAVRGQVAPQSSKDMFCEVCGRVGAHLSTEEMASDIGDGLGLMCVQSGDAEAQIYSPLISKGKKRAMRLKGYGNAIVAPVAIEFIKAYLDTE